MNIQIILNQFKSLWDFLNKISPSSRNLIILLLLGYIFYSLINISTQKLFEDIATKGILLEKKAEQYTKETAIEINKQVRLISDKDLDAYNVLLLSYHNNTLSLQGYKYLYLSCLTEAPRSLDTPLLKLQWNNIDYIYYADELTKIHNLSFVLFNDIESMGKILPKMYRLVKASDATAVTFFTIEGKESPIGLIVLLYKNPKKYNLDYPKVVLPSIQKISILLDYESKN